MVAFNPNTIEKRVLNLSIDKSNSNKGNLMSACITQYNDVSELTIVNSQGQFKFMYFDNDNDLFEVLSQLPIDPQNITYE